MKPIKLGSKQFLALQRKWYGKVKASGHVDVERFMDMNKLPISTMPRAHGPFLYDPEESDEFDQENDSSNGIEYESLADTDKARFWREVTHKATAMPTKDPLYKLANAFAEQGSFAAAARQCRTSKAAAEAKLKKWLKQNGLKDATGLTRRTRTEKVKPEPVRQLSKSEIKRLDYQSPKQIKDKP